MAEHPEDDAPEDLANSSEDPVDCRQALPLSPEPSAKVQHLVYYGSLGPDEAKVQQSKISS